MSKSTNEAMNMYILQDAMKAISNAANGPITPILDSQGLMIGISNNNQNNYCCPIQPNRLHAHAPDVMNQCQSGNCRKASPNDVRNSNQRLQKALNQITSDFDEPGKMWVVRDMELANNYNSKNNLLSLGQLKKRIRIDRNDFNSKYDEPKLWIKD